MTHRPLPLLLSLALAGCGEHTDDTTHDSAHASTVAATDDQPTTGGTTGGTTAAAGEPPAAPTDLTANILEGGVHLTWKDASDDEDQFVLENRADGAAEFTVVDELPFDSTLYHDLAVTSGTTYTYRVNAVNAAGASPSNEVMIAVP